MSSASSAPAPNPQISPQPATPSPRPSIVPPAQPQRRRPIWALFLILLAAGGGLAYYLKQANQTAHGSGTGIQVPTLTASLGRVNATIRINGTVAAQNYFALLAPRIQGSRTNLNRGDNFTAGGGGRGGAGGGGAMMSGAMMGGRGGGGGPMDDFSLVLMRLAKPGSRAKTGDIVAEFDPQMQLQRLDDYKDALISQESSVRKQLANLAAQKESMDQQVRSAKAAWDQAILDEKAATVRGAIDQEKARLTTEEKKLTYEQLLIQADLQNQSQESTIRAQELDRDQNRMELERSENNVKRMQMKTPIDGIVVMLNTTRNGELGQIREGDSVSSGQPFMQIVDPSSMVLNATVNQVDAEKLRLGMKATIRLDAYPELELPGTLDGIGAMSKTSTFRASYVGEIPVRLKIDKADARLIPDLTGSAEILMEAVQETVVLPRSAIFAEGDGSYVYVKGPEGWIRRKVEPGLASFTTVAIKSGVGKGETVALRKPI